MNFVSPFVTSQMWAYIWCQLHVEAAADTILKILFQLNYMEKNDFTWKVL